MGTTPSTQLLLIQGVGELRATSRGRRYLECESPQGQVMVLGSTRNMRNIRLLREQATPGTVHLLGRPCTLGGRPYWCVPEDALPLPVTVH